MTANTRVEPGRVAADIALGRDFLAGQPGFRRVWLFGSAGQGRPLDWRSDLDFAVEGLDKYALFELWSELDSRLTLPVDLVRWEDASPLLRQEITKGRLLHES